MAENVRALKLRIRSLTNTAKITKAMRMIAASKMRRAQEMVLAGRPYSEKIEVMLADLAAVQSQTDEALPSGIVWNGKVLKNVDEFSYEDGEPWEAPPRLAVQCTSPHFHAAVQDT